MVSVTHFTDPGCPWAYSASPALAVLRWRYGRQLDWRLVTIGLTERAEQYVERGYTPAGSARGHLGFRRFGMPLAPQPKPRVAATARMCRAIHATRLLAPERERAVFRALQFAQFTSPLVLDDASDLEVALLEVPGLDAAAIVAALDDPAVSAAYEADRAESRTAEGGPTAFQGKAAQTDGPIRYTAPSLLLESDGRRLEAGGFQTVEAYDVCVANLDSSLERQTPPDSPRSVLDSEPDGLTTQEISAVMTAGNDAPDRPATETALIDLMAEGGARRIGVGDDALWFAA
ncbi:MAG: DsbA family protein [Solirubrobacterales bacterium]|nr:DsbA family protein [Solirubrobacterales bacterium]